MTNRTWIEEVKLWGAVSSDKGDAVGYLLFGEEAKATINRNINQEFEELLEKIKKGTFIDPKLTAGENVQKFRAEIRTLIKQHIKEIK